MIYFAYDAAMDEREMMREDIAPGAILAGNGWLANRRLIFFDESGVNPIATPSFGDRLYGVLYFISDPREIERVKRLRWPISRRITRVRTIPYNRIVFAFTFEAEPEVRLYEGPASREYPDRLLDIARIRRFPEEYIEYLQSLPVLNESPHSAIQPGA